MGLRSRIVYNMQFQARWCDHEPEYSRYHDFYMLRSEPSASKWVIGRLREDFHEDEDSIVIVQHVRVSRTLISTGSGNASASSFTANIAF